MNARTLRTGLAVACAAAALAAAAVDPPHWSHTYPYTNGSATTQNIGCMTTGTDKGCHDGHGALGGVLTNALANANVCQSCHGATLQAAGLPVNSADAASMTNATGIHHNFGVACTNPAAGSAIPDAASPLYNFVTGFGNQAVCSTCHTVHSGATKSGSQNATAPERILGTGAGTISAAANASANPKGYLIEILAGGATFRLSNDNGVSWWGWNGSSWVSWTGANGRAIGSDIPLNDGLNVTVTFTGIFVALDRYYFYVSYPFLRVALDSGDNTTGAKFCRDCHGSWTMDHTNLEDTDGTKVMGHPVGIALGANGRLYDRAAPLDGDGQPQAGDRDGNPSNDLKLDSGNRIQCYTCHGVHYADSNTTTGDAP